MEQKLILNDGTVLENTTALVASGTLWVYIESEITLGEAVALLNDPEKTAVMTEVEFGNEKIYTGYTDLFCVRREDNGQVNAGLKKAVE